MIVVVDGSGVWLTDVDNLRQFHIDVDAALGAVGAVGAKLAEHGWGTLADDEHAWIAIDALRAAAGVRPEGWHDEFAAMIDYARSKGWVDDSGERLRAHIARSD